jgi:hypothetical protein
MSNQLQRALEQLHGELARHPQLDAATVESLNALLSEIPAAIADSQKPPGETTTANVSGQLQNLVASFGTRHPQLSATLAKLTSALSDLGI